ncbi:hypothetical protein [Bosea sp. ASV33]|uniref:hypothetical protein n=1 Tax=Bosea sp. ASV33 TaxID=2795106 RepID=UPI0018EA7181|nr:hypothetical protein [Bosea sp. ASV33]
MPIRSENKARYPKEWPAISAKIRERAGQRCEECGVENYTLGGRLPGGRWLKAQPTGDNGLRLEWPQPGDMRGVELAKALNVSVLSASSSPSPISTTNRRTARTKT